MWHNSKPAKQWKRLISSFKSNTVSQNYPNIINDRQRNMDDYLTSWDFNSSSIRLSPLKSGNLSGVLFDQTKDAQLSITKYGDEK